MEIRIPESIRSRLENIAKADGVSIDSFVDYVLSQRVAFEDIKAPDAESEPSDGIIMKGEQVGACYAE